MKKYTEIMEHIYPTQEQKNSMLENAFDSLEVPKKTRSKFRFRYCIPAVVIGMALSVNVFADEIKNTFYGLLGKSEIVSEEVLNDVYTDTDGHVRMSVKEVLSDKINSQVVIEYTALDEKGEDWLNNFLTVHELNFPKLSPVMKDNNTALYGVNYGYGYEEVDEYRTENTRVFNVKYSASGENFGTNSVDLNYPLSNKWENHAVIDVTESVELIDVKFDSSLAPEKYYKPLGVKISPMSLMIYGKDMGIVEKGVMPGGTHYMKVVHEEEIDSLYLVMKDKKRYNLMEDDNIVTDYGGSASVSNPEVDYDYSIYCAAFKDYMDLSMIDGIELDGVFYPIN